MILAIGMVLDAVLGEPKWLWSRLPHPAVIMGRFIADLDRKLNKGPNKQWKGILLLAILCFVGTCLGLFLDAIPGKIIDVVLIAVLLAQKSLAQHVHQVADGLRLSLAEGRRAVAQIVGRDTQQMDAPAVSRAAIESAAENLSDGVIAPAFWYLVAGLPGLILYKLVNTADSMIGYRSDDYIEFGWAAARADDVLNLIPARLTAFLLWLTDPRSEHPAAIMAEAPLHRSPNAGWPEAAMAHQLNVALSGPRQYEGTLRNYPFVNKSGAREIGPKDIDASVRVLWKTWALAVFAALIIALF